VDNNGMPVIFEEISCRFFTPLMCFFELLDIKVVLAFIVDEKLVNADLGACAYIAANKIRQLCLTRS
jgi:hypothetical protein